MPIPMICPNCNTPFQAQENITSSQVECPKCHSTFHRPGLGPEEPSRPDHRIIPERRASSPPSLSGRAGTYNAQRNKPVAVGGGQAVGLGIFSLVLAIIGSVLALIAFNGWLVGLPFIGIGLLLGLIGLLISLLNGWRKVAFPAAGLGANVVALVISLVCWRAAVIQVNQELSELANEIQKIAQQHQFDFDELEIGAQKQASQNNLRQIALAFHSFHDKYKAFPLAASDGEAGQGQLSWRVALLPYLGEQELFEEFNLKESWDSEHNRKLLTLMPALYSPVRSGAPPGHTYYQVFTSPDTPFKSGQNARIPATFRSGTANVLLVVEGGQHVPWTKPEDLPFDLKGPLPPLGGMFKGDFNAVTASAETRFVRRDRYSEELLRNLINPATKVKIQWPD